MHPQRDLGCVDCRVDLLEGRWFRDRPYERVEAIRFEEDVMDVDGDEPEDNENIN